MYRYKLLLLDLDGTLMDFEEAELRALKGCFTEFGLEPSQKNIKTYLAVNDALWHELEQGRMQARTLRMERFRRFLEQIGAAVDRAQAMSDSFLARLSESRDLMEGALDFLKAVRKGHSIAIVTNGFSDIQRSRLQGSPISDYIDRLYISEETGFAKPHPKMIQLAMQDFGIEDRGQVLFIGDSASSDLGAAMNAGIDCALIRINAHPKATYPLRSIWDAIAIANRRRVES